MQQFGHIGQHQPVGVKMVKIKQNTHRLDGYHISGGLPAGYIMILF